MASAATTSPPARPAQSSAAKTSAATNGATSSSPSASAPPSQATFLDLPADDSSALRLASLLLLGKPKQPPAPATGQRPKTFKPEPPSALFSRVAAFLPQLSAANADLQTSIAADAALRDRVDIENVDDDDEQYIEMNLGVGVFDTKPIPADGTRVKRRDDEEAADQEREIVMSTDVRSADAENGRPLIQVVSDTRTTEESDIESSQDSDSGEE
ncbi:hypothetical protein HDU86_003006 [Geranomyces michiganensis]|nr:hypothetical protein HDU86_003006 [Geranomyces michiganensis]